MEKFNPSYSLTDFKNSHFEITKTAQRTAADLGFNKKGIYKVISVMELKHFYKSMTSYYSVHKIYAEYHFGVHFIIF